MPYAELVVETLVAEFDRWLLRAEELVVSGTGPVGALTILHFSDLQFGNEDAFGRGGLTPGDSAGDPLGARLMRDLADLAARDPSLNADLVVVTGDLAERALPDEFKAAQHFLVALGERLKLPRHRIAVVPGNHDVNWNACEAYFKSCEGKQQKPEPPYWPKWDNFRKNLFEKLYRKGLDIEGCQPPRFTKEQPWSLFLMPELRVVVAGLNSTMEESHVVGSHFGHVGFTQLEHFAGVLRKYRNEGWLVIGAVHHNPVRGEVDDDANLRDAGDLDRLLGHRAAGSTDETGPLHLLLHGHTHDGGLHRLRSGLRAYATGSAATRSESRPPEVPRQYQLIKVSSSGTKRVARQYAPTQGRWVADVLPDPEGQSGETEQKFRIPAPAALTWS